MKKIFLKFTLALPDGVAEDPLEFLVAASMLFAGVLDILIPLLVEGIKFSRASSVPISLAWLIVASLIVGSIMTMIGIMMRKNGPLKLIRTIESSGLCLLAAGMLSIVGVDVSSVHTLSGISNIVLLTLIAFGLIGRAFIMRPGVYERIISRELNREVKRSITRK